MWVGNFSLILKRLQISLYIIRAVELCNFVTLYSLYIIIVIVYRENMRKEGGGYIEKFWLPRYNGKKISTDPVVYRFLCNLLKSYR